MKRLRRRYGRALTRAGNVSKAEATRRGEVAGSQHAVGWLLRNSPTSDEIESAMIGSVDSIHDVGRREAQDLFGYNGKQVELLIKAFADGYRAAWKKELMSEYVKAKGAEK
jgi:hypothetical protein